MGASILNINSDALVRHTARLEQMHKSALPIAVRQTLSRAAFDVKKVTMPAESDVFIHRKSTFFKSNSKVEPAKGFDISTMKAMVGFVPKPGDKSHSVEDLEQQEDGGAIGDRAFVPLKDARAAKAWGRMPKNALRWTMIKSKILNAENVNGPAPGQNFIKSAIYAGKGGFVIGTTVNANGNKMLYLINSIKRVDGDTKINSTPIYAVKAGRKVHPEAQHFMKKASDKSAGKMDAIFIEEANKQLAKIK